MAEIALHFVEKLANSPLLFAFLALIRTILFHCSFALASFKDLIE